MNETDGTNRLHFPNQYFMDTNIVLLCQTQEFEMITVLRKNRGKLKGIILKEFNFFWGSMMQYYVNVN